MRSPKVLVVVQPLKETLPSDRVARALEEGVRIAGATPSVLWGTDGGDGLLNALGDDIIKRSHVTVSGPLGEPTVCEIGWLDTGVAVVESRLACGISLVAAGKRNPEYATTRGVGEAIRFALGEGAKRIFVGLGGSATVDGGWGAATAFGWRFFSDGDRLLVPGVDGLFAVARVEPGAVPAAELTVLCDVAVPFAGPLGSVLFAEQKGATREFLGTLEAGIDEFVRVLPGATDCASQPGSGAAGGLGFGLRHFLGGRLESGSNWLLDRCRFDSLLDKTELVVVTEGRFDRTSMMGKLTGTVVTRAESAGVPILVVAPATDGQVGDRPGLFFETGGGIWDEEQLKNRTATAVARVLNLIAS